MMIRLWTEAVPVIAVMKYGDRIRGRVEDQTRSCNTAARLYTRYVVVPRFCQCDMEIIGNTRRVY